MSTLMLMGSLTGGGLVVLAVMIVGITNAIHDHWQR